MLEKLFFNKSMTAEQLLSELYVSSSTLNRLASTINEELQSYGLQLETTPYRISGNELLIRHFYTTYFVEAYATNEWPFERLDQKIIDEVLPSADNYYKSTSEDMNYTAFRFQFAVGVIRNLHGYSIKGPFLTNEKLMDVYKALFLEVKKRCSMVSLDTALLREIYTKEIVTMELFISENL